MACEKYLVEYRGPEAALSVTTVNFIDCGGNSNFVIVNRNSEVEIEAEQITGGADTPGVTVTPLGLVNVSGDGEEGNSTCKSYNVTVESGRNAPGFIQYTRCGSTARVDRVVAPGATLTLNDVGSIIQSVGVVAEFTGESTGGGGGTSNKTRVALGLIGLSNSAASQVCSRFVRGEIPLSRFYIDDSFLSSVSSGGAIPESVPVADVLTRENGDPAPDGYYTNGSYYIKVENGQASSPVRCNVINLPGAATLYEIRSCFFNQEVRAYTDRPQNLPAFVQTVQGQEQRVTIASQTWVYTGGQKQFLSSTDFYYAPQGIVGTNSAGCTATSTQLVRRVVACSSSSTRPKYGFFQDFPTESVSDLQQFRMDGELFYFDGTETEPSDGRYDRIAPNDVTFTGRTRCNIGGGGTGGGGGGGGTGGPPPAPTTVQKRLFETIRPSLQSAFNAQCAAEDFNQAAFQPGIIRVNGEEVGRGDVTVTFTIGEEYVIEFELPSHPSFDFSIGNNIVRFTATTDNSPIEAIVVPTFIPSTAVLNVSTNFSPSIGSGTGGVIINLSGKGKIGVDQVRGYELTEGTYTISFEPIQVPGMLFVTPREQVITITSKDFCKTYNITGTFIGVPLPKGFWLKEFDGSEQSKLRAQFTKGMFSNNIGNMVNFYSSSISDSLDNHYTHVYHEPSGSATASIQFSLAYGHYNGSGSNDLGGQYMDTPTRAIYGQYRSIVTEGAQKLNLTGTETEHFYVLSYQKDRRDTRADYRALEINLAHLSGSEFINGIGSMATHTGSNVTLGGLGKVLRLTSDYSINDEPDVAPLQYNIVSGSVEDGVYNSTSPHYYGKVYPSLGLVLLDANKLDASASFGTVTSREVDGKNQLKLFTAISGAAQYTDQSGDPLGMKARATKEELNLYYFIHVRNREFNLSNNPSYFNTTGLQFLKYGIPNNVKVDPAVLDATGIVDEQFQLKPKTYITTIGLYNEHRELVAVGKISRPEIKSFTDEVMYTVKIKY